MSARDVVYKICGRAEWEAAAHDDGLYRGSADDRRDGFVHFSLAHQLETTARKHFSGREDLVLVAIDAARLGAALRFEASRSGDLFPHLYGPLPTEAATFVLPLPWDGTRHLFPSEVRVTREA